MATILIVDDRPTNREFLVTLLGYSGHRLLEASDGLAALALTRTEHPDLVITDILMPTMDGYEFVQRLRADPALAHTVVIFYTATYSPREAQTLAQSAGVAYVVMKPAEPEVILKTVAAALDLAEVSLPRPPSMQTGQFLRPSEVLTQKLAQKVGELDQVSSRLAVMVNLGLDLAAERDPVRLLDLVCRAARDIVGAAYAAVGILAKDGKTLQHFVTSGLDPETIARIGAPPTGQGLLGALLTERRSIRLRDLTTDPRSAGFPPGHPSMRSFLGVPIASSTQVYGRLYLTNKVSADEFSEEDERLALTLATQAAVAYENTGQYDEIQRHAARLQLEMTERKRAEQAQRESERQMVALVTSLDDVVFEFDAQGTYLNVWARDERLLARPKAELLGRRIDEVLGEENGRPFTTACQRVLASGKFEDLEYFLDVPGGRRWFRARLSPILSPDGPAQTVSMLIRDITQRKQAEATILQLAAIVESSDDAIISRTLAGQIVSWNTAAERLSGYAADQVKGQPHLIIIPADQREAALNRLEQLKAGEHIGHFETVRLRQNGQRVHVTVGMSPIKDAQGQLIGVATIERDITERKRAEEALQQAPPIEKRQRLARVALEIAVVLAGSLIVAGLAYYFDLYELLIDVLPSNDALDELVFILAFLIFAFTYFSYRRWKEVSAEIIQRRQAQEALRTLHGDLENRVQERTADLARSNEALRAEIGVRQQVEARLRLSDEILQRVASLILVADANGQIVYASPSFEKILGYTPAELLGEAWWQLSRSDLAERQAEQAAMGAVARGNAPVSNEPYERLLTAKDGSQHWIEWQDASVPGHRVVGVGHDVTERKQTEKQLQYQATLLQNVSDAIVASDLDFNITSWNEGAALLYGWRADEIIGKPTQVLMTTYPYDQAEQVRRQFLEQGLWKGEAIQQRKDGKPINILSSVTLIKDGGGQSIGVVAVNRDITDRKQAEAALATAHTQLKTIFDNLDENIYSVDTVQWKVLQMSPACEKIYGRPPEAFLKNAQLWRDVIHPDDLPIIEKNDPELAEGKSIQQEYRVLRPDGEMRWVESRIKPTLNTTGQLVRLDGVTADITQRKQIEVETLRRAMQVEALAQISQLFAASAAEYMAVLEIVAQRVSELVGDGCAIRLVSDDGQWLNPVALSHADPDMLGLVREIMAAAPQRADQSLPARIFQTGQPVLLPGLTTEQVHGLFPSSAWPLLDHYKLLGLVIIPLRAQGGIIGTLAVVREASRRPFTDDEVNFLQDLADRAALAISNARLLEQVQAQNAELERRVAERTADLSRANIELEGAARSKDEFLASMSHELRTPLNAILSLSESLEEGTYGPLSDRQLKPLHTVAESGQHLLNLINDILDLSKIEAGKLELQLAQVEVEPVCQASLRLVKQLAQQKRLQVSLSMAPNVTTVRADARRLKQMLVNLLSNAVKFTPEGGQIGLEVRGETEQSVVNFTVWDTGIGIASEQIQRLFRPFVQIDSGLDRQYGGTGLGLALVYRMAEMHGGSVSLQSNPGQGSRFTISLPWAGPGEPHITGPLIPMNVPNVHKVLVIEDSPTAAEQLMRYLSELGGQVTVYSAGESAFSDALELQPDIIFLDIQLPGLSGWEVLKKLKADARTYAIPVIVVTVVDERERGLALGATDYVVKPLTRRRLHEALRKALPTSPVPSPEGSTPEGQSVSARLPLLLLAEDNPANQTTYSDYLMAKGYQVIVANNGAEALDRARETRPDLILMDVQMPGMDGLEAMRRLRADPHLHAIPVIAITALAMPGDRERCLAAGANDYLTKPVSLKQLAQTIEAYLERRST